MSTVEVLPTVLPKNHFTLKTSYDLESFCKVLDNYGITSFGFTRIYNDLSRFVLTNRPDWAEHCYNKGYIYLTRLNRHPSCYQSGYYLWDAFDPNHSGHQLVGTDAAENFNIGRGMSIVEKTNNWIDKYDFASTPNNYAINNFYINNFELLNNFINTFKQNAKNLIDAAAKNRGIVPYDSNLLDMNTDYHDTLFSQKNPDNNVFSISNNTNLLRASLTKRELECICWLTKGKTTPEIAIILNISSRTVEKYITSLKHKLDCYTLFQLGKKIDSLGL